MRNYNSLDGLIWTENKEYKYNKDEIEILNNSNNKDFNELVAEILLKKIDYIGENNDLTNLVVEYMPDDMENVKLLSVNFIQYEENNITSGIINYRINNEHKQIRW